MPLKSKKNFKTVKSDKELERAIQSQDGAVVQFLPLNCESCHSGGDLLRLYSKQKAYRKMKFLVADVTVVKQAAIKYKIESGPKDTIICFRHGVEVTRFS